MRFFLPAAIFSVVMPLFYIYESNREGNLFEHVQAVLDQFSVGFILF